MCAVCAGHCCQQFSFQFAICLLRISTEFNSTFFRLTFANSFLHFIQVRSMAEIMRSQSTCSPFWMCYCHLQQSNAHKIIWHDQLWALFRAHLTTDKKHISLVLVEEMRKNKNKRRNDLRTRRWYQPDSQPRLSISLGGHFDGRKTFKFAIWRIRSE